jgi:formylglycine-generating enzyme required for sulfatase activity
MRRGLMRLRWYLTIALMMIAAALLLIQPQTSGGVSATVLQGKGGTIKPVPTPTPAPKKVTPHKAAPTATRVNTKPNQSAKSKENDAAATERTYWESIRNSTDLEDFREYLKKYPNGEFAGLAKNRLNVLEEAKRKEEEAKKAAKRPGAVVKNQMGIEFAYVPAGSFMMGSSDAEVQAAYKEENHYKNNASLGWFKPEKPKHQVTIREGFYMGRYEVTQAQWQAVMGNNPSEFKGCDSCPVEGVSWNDAQEFIKRLNAREDGFTYRLPSESEWEYACRAGTTTEFAFGNSLSSDQANFNGNFPSGGAGKGVYRQKTTPAGSFQPNAWGLYDMQGNVYEWCEDIWHYDYDGAPADGSAWLSGGSSDFRILRGGSWYEHAGFVRSAYRFYLTPNYRADLYGFRLVALARIQ